MGFDIDKGIMPEPDDLKTLLETDSEIYVFSGSDQGSKLRGKLDLEWDNMPLINPRLQEDTDGQMDITGRMTIVYVVGFFTDGCDFLFYVRGGTNMSKFLAGTFSGKPYDAPCFASPMAMYEAKELFNSPELDTMQMEKVPKTETKGIRWKYLYESAVKAWEKLQFDPEKVETIKERDEWLRQQQKAEGLDSSSSEDDTSDGDVIIPASPAVEPETPTTAPTTPGPKGSDNGSDDDKECLALSDDERVEDSDLPIEASDAEGDEDSC